MAFTNCCIENALILYKLEMKEFYNVPMVMISVVSALFYSVYDGSQIFVGRLVATLKLNQLVAISSLTLSLSFISARFVNSYWIFAIFGVIFGAVQSIFLTIAIHCLMMKGFKYSFLFPVHCFTSAIMIALTGVMMAILDELYTWRSSFMLLGGFFFNFFPVFLYLRLIENRKKPAQSFDKATLQEEVHLKSGNRRHLIVTLLILGQCLFTKVYINFKTYMPFYLDEFYQMSLQEVSLYKMLSHFMAGAFSMLGLLILGKINPIWGVIMCQLFVFLGNTFSIAFVCSRHYLWTIVVLLSHCNTVYIFITPQFKVWFSETETVHLFQLSRFVQSIVLILLGTVTGLLYDSFGSVVAVYGFSIFLSAAVIVISFILLKL